MAKDRLASVSKYWAWGGLKFTSLSVWPEDELAITSPDHLAGDWLEIDNCAMCDEGCIFTLLTWRLLNWCSEQRTTTQLDQFYRTASSSDILATSTTYLYIYTLRVWIIQIQSCYTSCRIPNNQSVLTSVHDTHQDTCHTTWPPWPVSSSQYSPVASGSLILSTIWVKRFAGFEMT